MNDSEVQDYLWKNIERELSEMKALGWTVLDIKMQAEVEEAQNLLTMDEAIKQKIFDGFRHPVLTGEKTYTIVLRHPKYPYAWQHGR